MQFLCKVQVKPANLGTLACQLPQHARTPSYARQSVQLGGFFRENEILDSFGTLCHYFFLEKKRNLRPSDLNK